MGYSTENKGTWLTGAILLFVAVLFLFLPFIGLSFVAFGLAQGGISPFTMMRVAFMIVQYGGMLGAGGGVIALAVVYILLFFACVVLPILTGIMALVNKKYFPPWITVVVYGLMCILWIVLAIVINSNMGTFVGELGMLSEYAGTSGLDLSGVGNVVFLPTLWLFLGLACVVIPVFFLRKYIAPPPPPEPVTAPVNNEDWGVSTIPASKSNKQGVQVQVRYSDDSGTHVVKRQILTDRPMTVGRSDSCSVVLADARASSVHARLKYDDLNGLVIEDNNSTNGIQVNGETVMKLRRISKEDSIRIGDSKLQFTVVGSLDDFDGEKTIAAGDRYHEPIKVRLNFTDDSGPRIENVILKESAMIGSMRECDVSIDSTTVSHKHARLVNLGGGRIAIEDNASTNGIIVNGERVDKRSPVGTGDVITLGDVNIRVTL